MDRDQQNECTVYVRFPVSNNKLEEAVIQRLFSQFGGFLKLCWKSDTNYAFVIYEKPKYALYVCNLLNGIRFLNGHLTVKPRDGSKNASLFNASEWSQPRRTSTYPIYYRQLDRIPFEQFDPEQFLMRDQ